jgi:hypothetical protein
VAPGVENSLRYLAACRTAALGGHATCCTHCGEVRYHYHSCGDRHCPQCGGNKRFAWLERQRRDLLPVPYFHVVFTLPHSLSALVMGNRDELYRLLFEAAAQTLLQVAAYRNQLGARIGLLAVLHTWGQQLEHHPHLHCVVPGGGLACDPQGNIEEPWRWVSARPDYFLPVKVLAKVFRGKFLQGLQERFQQGRLRFAGSTQSLAQPTAFRQLLRALYPIDWVVYAKEPFGGPEQVLKYLTRYTHRVAISNQRLLKLADDRVTFSYKDYAAGCQRKELTLDAVEFLRRFSLHIIPKGLVRLRQYGLLSNRGKAQRLARCRTLLQPPSKPGDVSSPTPAAASSTIPSPAATTRPSSARASLGASVVAALLLPLATTAAVAPASAAASLTTVPIASDQKEHPCPGCGQGRLEVIWQQPRPTGPQLGRSWRWNTS